ncbi:MAG: PEGA domain-containing protein [Spirochaetes bacterium]|nr:PEGA domain-containing protein [Spirochaetota bacterium]
MKRYALIVAVLLASSGALFAQNKTSLNIICNQVGAQVLIDGKLAGYTTPNFSFLLPAGNRTITVTKAGFQDFVQTLKVTNNPITLNVNLVPKGAVAPPPQVLKHVLTVNANVNGAQVILNNIQAGITPFQTNLAPGSYSLVVRANGYSDYSQNLTINGNTTVNAMLQAMTAPLSINVNVPGAEIWLNGGRYGQASGNTFSAAVPPGSYALTVRAAGYTDYNTQINVMPGSGYSASVTLQPATAPLSLTINVAGAEIFLNGSSIGRAQGQQFATQVMPGTYALTIRAVGYADFNAQINVMPGSGYAGNINLQFALANFQFTVPAAILNPEMKGNPWSQVRLYIDGGPQKDFRGQLLPGRHVIRVVSGAIQIETTVDIVAGGNYTFELGAMLTVK